MLPLGTWISPHHFRNLLVSQARRRRLEKCERVQNREGSESSLRVSYWSSNNGSTGRATHSIVLLRQHTVLLRCHLLQTDIANVMGDEQVWRAAPSQKMDQPRNLFRILNGTTVRAELAATAQSFTIIVSKFLNTLDTCTTCCDLLADHAAVQHPHFRCQKSDNQSKAVFI